MVGAAGAAFYFQADDYAVFFQHKIDLLVTFPPVVNPEIIGQTVINQMRPNGRFYLPSPKIGTLLYLCKTGNILRAEQSSIMDLKLWTGTTLYNFTTRILFQTR